MREIPYVNKHLGGCLALIVIRVIKIRAVLRCYLILIKLATPPPFTLPLTPNKMHTLTSRHGEVGSRYRICVGCR